MEFYDFLFRKGNFIIPTDELHHFSEGQGSTTIQLLTSGHQRLLENRTMGGHFQPRLPEGKAHVLQNC